jgi:hypothetical protein
MTPLHHSHRNPFTSDRTPYSTAEPLANEALHVHAAGTRGDKRPKGERLLVNKMNLLHAKKINQTFENGSATSQTETTRFRTTVCRLIRLLAAVLSDNQ